MREVSLVDFKQLVSRESACLDGHDRTALDASHAMMNKFRGPHDGKYLLVSSSIRRFLEDVQIKREQTSFELACLHCLTSSYREDKDRIERRVAGTCGWALDHSKYLSWKQSTSDLLWISADPGCGKSVLAKAIVDERLVAPDPRTTLVCYFFFKDDDASRQGLANALSSILHQLFTEKPLLLQYAMKSFRSHGLQLNAMSSVLWDILMEAADDSEAGEIVCVLDALDECRELDRKTLICKLGDFYADSGWATSRLKFLMTSRPYSDIESAFGYEIDCMESISLRGEYETEKISKEINMVIDERIPRICKARRHPLPETLQVMLKEKLKEIPNRTYLWLHLMFDVIRDSLDSTKPSLQKLLEKLPRTIYEAYERILSRIQAADQVDKARRILQLVMAAIRPLTLQEMSIAYATDERHISEEDIASFDELDVDIEENFRYRVRNLCGLFVSVVNNKIYLIHQTARDFLISRPMAGDISAGHNLGKQSWEHSLSLMESNLRLLKICVTNILVQSSNNSSMGPHAVIGQGDPISDVVNHELLDSLTRREVRTLALSKPHAGFLEYAANHWLSHYHGASDAVSDQLLEQVLKLCDTQSQIFAVWYWIQYDVALQSTPTLLSLFLFLTSFSLDAIAILLLDRGVFAINTQDRCGRTLLFCSAQEGRLELLKTLIGREGVDVHRRDVHGRTPLSIASERGHTEVARFLLNKNPDGTSINPSKFRSTAPETPRDLRGNEHELARHESSTDINAQDKLGLPPFYYACDLGRTETVKLLLQQGTVHIDKQDEYGRTPLMRATQRGHSEVVKLILEQNGVNINLKDSLGWTALQYAATLKTGTIAEMLLEKDGIEVSIINLQGKHVTPLQGLAYHGHARAVQLLLDKHDIDVNPRDPDANRTPLSVAAEKGHLEVVKRLLEEWDIDVEIRDRKRGWLPAWFARYNGHDEIYRLLEAARME